jgi:DNA-binding NarL/FixJ family response regulator
LRSTSTSSTTTPEPRRLDALTDREREVLPQLANGSSNAEISDALYIAGATVKSHVSNILTELGLRDSAQAVVFAYESGLITPAATTSDTDSPSGWVRSPDHGH